MASDDKTEKATPKRKEEARKEGNVLRSMEINSAAAMLTAFGLLAIWGPKMWGSMQRDMVYRLKHLSDGANGTFTQNDVMGMFFAIVRVILVATAPVMVGMMVVGVLASVVQVRPKITPSILKPRFSKLNPINGAKQKFGPSAIFEALKSTTKLVAVGIPAAMLLWGRRNELLNLGDAEPIVAGLLAIDLTMSIGFRVAGIYVAIAIIDLLWQKHRYEKNLKMTKHEVKQEHRQQELAPEMKAAQRRRQRDMARRRMLQDIPTADVIITNPTHYAVALKYDNDLGAPQVVAKGVDLLAARIRDLADECGVMRVENKALARELYATVEVGNTIPADLFAAVAEVLAYVYRAEERARRSGERVRDPVAS